MSIYLVYGIFLAIGFNGGCLFTSYMYEKGRI